jgi:Zn finger protein HypA/HybF involved in hydrogenase expression
MSHHSEESGPIDPQDTPHGTPADPPPEIAQSLIDAFNCRRCGYPLAGLPAGGACPECGEPVARSVPSTPDLTDRTCVKCSYTLAGLPADGVCPECGTPVATSAPGVPDLAQLSCVTCAYSLAGLSWNAVCPECGTPVANSLKGNRLEHAGLPYLDLLHRGLVCILTAIVAQVLLTLVALVGGVGVAILAGTAMGTPNNSAVLLFTFITTVLGSLVGLVSCYGWWIFSTPDPGFVGRDDGGQARKLLRVSVVALAAFTVLQSIPALPALAMRPAVAIGSMGIGLIALVFTALWFFGAILYIRWLAPRAGSERATRLTRSYIWLLPVLGTVGVVLCGLGPLAAWILYAHLMYLMYKDVARCRQLAIALAESRHLA